MWRERQEECVEGKLTCTTGRCEEGEKGYCEGVYLRERCGMCVCVCRNQVLCYL